MIVRDRPSPVRLFFIMRGSIIPQIAPHLIFVVVFSLALLLAEAYGITIPHISLQALASFGIALSLFLGFRNNAAYDRWWEARKLWGQLIADIRSLSRETKIYLGDSKQRSDILSFSCAFSHFLRGGLRKVDARPEAAQWVGETWATRLHTRGNPACATLNEIAGRLHTHRKDGDLGDFGGRVLTERLATISLAQAGCERIASTPLPFVYSLLVSRTAYLYCLLVPFGLLEAVGPLTPLVAGIIAYVFFGLAAVTDELETPFANNPNGLPLDAMCRTMENSVAEALGAEPRPAHNAHDYVLT